MEALLDAATELLAARGPAAVSVREIASRAGVNQGLLHRHFGSKEALLRAVLERLTRRLVPRGPLDASPAAGLQLVAAEAATAAHYRILARAILDGQSPEQLLDEFPLIAHLIEFFRARQAAGFAPEMDARLLAAGSAAMTLGWLLFEPLLAAGIGLRGRDDEARRAFLAIVQQLDRRLQGAAPADT